MTVARVCSECGESLSGRPVQTRTCSDKCRKHRSVRLRRLNEENPPEVVDEGTKTIRAIVNQQSPDVITRVMQDELKPIVREALTEEVLQAVQQMLGLTPRAVQLLQQDLESEDSTVRQRAYTLVTKYTIGHPALLKPEESASQGQMVVQFNLPRPDNPEPSIEPEQVEELRVCDMCNAEKAESEFAAGSSRCQDCFEAWRSAILDQFT